jgi:phage shock protein PspC (stress-responsive transcriptional regulator)
MNENDNPGVSPGGDASGSPGMPASSVDAPLPPPPAPPRPPFPFVRARHDRKLGGVAGGLATAAGLDPTLVRMGMVVGALTGWLVLAYLIAWALLPEEDEEAGRPLAPASEDAARLLRIGLAVVAGLGALQIAGIVAGVAFAIAGTIGALFRPFIDPFAGSYGGFNPDFPVRGIAGLILLAGGGLFLLRHRRGDLGPRDGAGAGSGGGAGWGGGGFTPPPPPGAPVPPGGPAASSPAEPPAASRWRSAGEWILLITRATGWLLALWFAAAGAVLAAFWAFDAISLRIPLLLAMVTLGALGLMGTVLVRSRRPALLVATAAVLLVPAILTLVLARWNGVAGYRALTPTSTAEIPDAYLHAAGEFRLDLSQLSLPAGTTEVEIDMGAGEVEVTVPWDVTVEGAATVGVGEFNLLGRSQAGLSLDGEVHSVGQPGAPTIKLTGRVSAGQFKIFRRSPPATRVALETGQPVRLECRPEGDGVRCVSPDSYPTPTLDCLVSVELENLCRPTGQPLPDDGFPDADRPGTRRCTIPPGGGVGACGPPAQPKPESGPGAETPPAEGTPPSTGATPSMPPGTYVCDFPAGGGPATCRPA